MELTKISRSKSFEMTNGFGLKHWDKLGAEMSLTPGDDPKMAYKVMDELIEETHKESYREYKPFEEVKQVSKEAITAADKEIDKLFKQVKTKLSKYSNREDAQTYLSTTDFKLNIELKNIIQSLPIKSKN